MKQGKELLEIHVFPIFNNFTKWQIFVTLFSCDTCFFVVLIYVLFIRQGRIINQTKIEHLRVYYTLA